MSDDRPASDSRRTSRSLLQRARDKEPDAWQRLVALYDPLVRHWCKRAGVATQDVDDVVQEVFAKAFASLQAFRHSEPSDTFRGWLHGVTRHRVLEHFRRVRRQIAAAGGSDAQGLMQNQPDLHDGWAAPDEEEKSLNGQLYRRALEFIRGEFEPRTWQLFWRSVVDGLPTASVAAELGVSAAAVRQARSRILRRIREETAGLNLTGPGAVSAQ
ncbi:MAG TPA: sigma-70 family RNA polymerase sigma factor [Gemmataceae bacterium]|nr:sigma-70 family RNA polymerase sigma factor [Gemmataceae bacterium]